MNKDLNCRYQTTSQDTTELEYQFLKKIELTIDSRFEAGKRLKKLSKVSFITTTIISLGLILIPLLNSAGHNVAFSNETMGNFQMFLAICILVFSVATSTAQYEIRSKEFFECSDKLSIICQEFKIEKTKPKSDQKNVDLKDFELRYRNALNGTENHEDIDYIKAKHIRNLKYTKGYKKRQLFTNSEYIISTFFMYISPIFLSALEIIFIFDMLGITSFLNVVHKNTF